MDGHMNAGAFSMSSSEPTRLRAQRGDYSSRGAGGGICAECPWYKLAGHMRTASLKERRWLLASGNASHCPFESSGSLKFQAKRGVTP